MSSTEQQLIPAELAASYIQYTGRHVFLTGKAGTGKTTFLRNIIDITHKKAIIVAPTGIAAINAGGVTIHMQFQLPFGTFLPDAAHDDAVRAGIQFHTMRMLNRHIQTMRAQRKAILSDLELLIIDEVSMLRADVLDAIDHCLRFVRRSRQPFGGVQLLFIGDLHQLPPVVKQNEMAVMNQWYNSAYFFDAHALRDNPPVLIELDKIYRQDDQTFINLLNNIRHNRITEEDVALLKRYYRPNFKPDAADNYITLTTHNKQAIAINQENLDALDTRSFFFHAEIEDDFSESAYPVEKVLELKSGAQVMFVKNDPTGEGRFYNGKLAVVSRISSREIEVELTGSNQKLILEPYRWESARYVSDETSGEIIEEIAGTFTQYPVRLAWAITVHKSQGLTFEKAIIDVGKAFAAGQIYVALSRMKSLDGLVLLSPPATRGIEQDRHIISYHTNRDAPGEMAAKLENETLHFLGGYLLTGFDFSRCLQMLKEHHDSYTRDAQRSSKQKSESWAGELLVDFQQLKNDADKFCRQLQKLFAARPADLGFIAARIASATGFFAPKIAALSDRVLEHIAQVKVRKQVKLFVEELLAIELALFEQQKRVLKSNAIVQAVLAKSAFTRQDVEKLANLDAREEKLKAALAPPERTETGERTEKKPKVKKGDSRLISLQLLREGKSLADIAGERGMALSTIESHFAQSVATQEISAAEVISSGKLDIILAAIRELQTLKMNLLKVHLGDTYSFGEIRIGLAHYLANPDD